MSFLAKYVILKLPFLGKDDLFWVKITYFGQKYVILTEICPFLAKYVILKFAKITFFGQRWHILGEDYIFWAKMTKLN